MNTTTISIDTILSIIKSAGPTGILALILWMMYTGKLVPSGQVEDLKATIADKSKEIEFWKGMYQKILDSTRTTVDVTASVLETLSKRKKDDSP